MPTKHPSHIGRFEVLERIGQGGMGILYLARDPVLQRSVAIKVLSVHNQELLERFGREARSVASLRHQHIVTIYDIGEDHGNPFIAMEYIDGETLDEIIRRKFPLSLARKFELILQLCDGLGYAHRAGLIHRDIKPANLMITSDGVLKILDFGLARLVSDDAIGLTVAGAIMGTPQYMSPEQIEGQRVDHRSDIFAVGLVIYELLTYCKAFPGENTRRVLQKIMTTEPQPMRELESTIDPDLEQVVSHAIEKSPDQRYQQLASLAKDLSRIRSRLQASANESTILVDKDSSSARVARPITPSARAGQIPNLEAITRRRKAQVDGHVVAALEHFQGGRLEAAIEQCEQAVLLDPNSVSALDLLKNAHQALEDRQIRTWLEEAQTNLSRGALTAAAPLIEKALQFRPNSAEAQLLQQTLQDRRREQERARETARAVRAAIDRALVNFLDGALEAAVRSTSEALAYDPDNEEALTLKQQATDALEERRQQQDLDQQASATVAAARQYAATGDYQRGLHLLTTFSTAHPLVDVAVTEITREADRVDALRRAEEEAIQRARLDEETRQLARLDEEARQRARLDEETRQLARLDAEARERARLEEEAKQRARLEEEARQRARLEEEAKQRARLEEEAKQRARLEEEARQRARLEEEALQRALAEEEARQRAQLEEQARQRARAEEEARLRARAEEEARQRAQLEEQARLRARAEEEARQRARAEEEARRARFKEEAKQLALEEEARLRARAEEEARQRARLKEEANERARLKEEARQRGRVEEERQRSKTLAAEDAAPPIEFGLPAPDAMRDAAGEAGPAKPLSGWRPRPAHAMMVGGAAAAAAIIAAVVLLQNASPEPGPPNAPPVVSGPIEKPPTVATPDSAPKETPPATAPGVGVLVLDALPWAEVVDIVDAAGTRQTLPPNAATPIFLELPPGDYDITLKNGSSRSVKARVKAGEITQPAPLDFGQIDAAEYFRRLKW